MCLEADNNETEVENEPEVDSQSVDDHESEVDNEEEAENEPLNCSAPATYEELEHSLSARIQVMTAAEIPVATKANRSSRRLLRLIAATTRLVTFS